MKVLKMFSLDVEVSEWLSKKPNMSYYVNKILKKK